MMVRILAWLSRIIIGSFAARLGMSLLHPFKNSWMDKKKRREFVILIFLTCIAVGGGTIFYHINEKWSWINSAYFCISTLTTVGYGDFAPKTDEGKLFSMVFMLLGIGILISLIENIASIQQNQANASIRKIDEVIDDIFSDDEDEKPKDPAATPTADDPKSKAP